MGRKRDHWRQHGNAWITQHTANVRSTLCNLNNQDTRWYPGHASISDALKSFRAAECVFKDFTTCSLTSPSFPLSAACIRPHGNSVVTVMKHRSSPIRRTREVNGKNTSSTESMNDPRTALIMNSWFRLIENAYSTSFTNRNYDRYISFMDNTFNLCSPWWFGCEIHSVNLIIRSISSWYVYRSEKRDYLLPISIVHESPISNSFNLFTFHLSSKCPLLVSFSTPSLIYITSQYFLFTSSPSSFLFLFVIFLKFYIIHSFIIIYLVCTLTA